MMGIPCRSVSIFSRFYEQANLRKRLEMGEWWADFLEDALENEVGKTGERD